jgi:hypothetical protein
MPGNPQGGRNSDLGRARRFGACPNRKAHRLYGIMLSTKDESLMVSLSLFCRLILSKKSATFVRIMLQRSAAATPSQIAVPE